MTNELNLTAPLNSMGYGVCSWNLLKALDKKGVKTSLWTIGESKLLNYDDNEEKRIYQESKHRAVMFNQYSPSLRIWHQFDMAQHVGKGIRCGLPFFELNKFHNYERHHLSYLDKIFVSSKWAKNIVEQNIPHFDNQNIHIVNMGVDRNIFNPNTASSNRPKDDDKTVFLNMGKWEIRKGHDVLIEAFCDAFKSNDNVHLIMACTNPFLNETQTKEWEKLYKDNSLGNKVTILPRVKNHNEVANIMSASDCGVFPSRAEGWNMEALEMMSLGKKIIITDYSAHTEFCNEKNSMRIPIFTEEPAYDGIWFHAKETDRNEIPSWGHFGDSQHDLLVHYLRETHKEKQENGFIEINKHGIETAEQLSWDKRPVEQLISGLGLTTQ